MEIVSYIVTNGISVIFLFLCWRNPRVGRLLFFILFLMASCLNLYTATQRPEVYQYFAELTWLNAYRQLILGWLNENAGWFVTVIAVCQMFIAISMWLKGPALKTGAFGAMFFFISIVPLGFGSAFPGTLIMAFAMLFIFKSTDQEYLWRGATKPSSSKHYDKKT